MPKSKFDIADEEARTGKKVKKEQARPEQPLDGIKPHPDMYVQSATVKWLTKQSEPDFLFA